MELIRGIEGLAETPTACVATIGNFDGIHLGHQRIVGRLLECAREQGLPSVVITFEPYPQEYFAPTRAPARLSRLREKVELLSAMGVDKVLLLRFGRQLAKMPADEFIQTILLRGLGVRHLVVGDDFRFGRDRQGDFAMLQEAGARYGFLVEDTPTVDVDGERVSSTRLRLALEAGDLALARRLLGQDYVICGRVCHGDKRGRLIGFPTANIPLRRAKVASRGVYAVSVEGAGETRVQGVANIGNRPTVDGVSSRLEVHLFDFDGELYGRYLKVSLLKFLRPEMKFSSVEELRAQIARDSEQARAFFQKN